jgi:heat shock protein HtpX
LEKISAAPQALKSANKATAPMYIINPLHKEGRAATDLTSTHPPISERIRILRSMAGGAAYANYEAAYEQVKKKSLLSKAAVTSVGVVGLRAATAPAQEVDEVAEKTARSREASDLMLKMNNYRTIDCTCGARWKLPQGFQADSIQCTRCGRTLKLK